MESNEKITEGDDIKLLRKAKIYYKNKARKLLKMRI